MNIDKPIIIGDRLEIIASALILPVFLTFMVWILFHNASDVWMWIITVVLLWGTVDSIKDYLKIRRNKVVGTTIKIDSNGITIEEEGKPVRELPWHRIHSLTFNYNYINHVEFTVQIKRLFRPKTEEKTYSFLYAYIGSHIIPMPNLWTLRQKVSHFSGGKVQVNYSRNAQRLLKLYRLFSPYK